MHPDLLIVCEVHTLAAPMPIMFIPATVRDEYEGGGESSIGSLYWHIPALQADIPTATAMGTPGSGTKVTS